MLDAISPTRSRSVPRHPVLAAASEERVLFEVAIVDGRCADVASAVGPSVQGAQRAVDAVENALGSVQEPPVLLELENPPRLRRAVPRALRERRSSGLPQRRHRSAGYPIAPAATPQVPSQATGRPLSLGCR